MADDTLPPVGATVTDWVGSQYVWSCGWSGTAWYLPGGIKGRDQDWLTFTWRMQQERDGLKARVAELEQEMALRQHLYDVHPGPDTEELAAFRALAVEAKAMLATEAYRTAKQPAAHLLFRLAALAPKEASHE